MEILTARNIVLTVSALFAIILIGLITVRSRDRADYQFAATAGRITDAARLFSSIQRTTIINAAQAAGGAVHYGVTDMVAAGAITSASATTPTGGTWCVEFRAFGSPVHLQGILTIIGETAPYANSSDPMVLARATGRPYTGVVTSAGGTAVGSDFSQALSAFAGAGRCSPGANAFAALISDDDSIGGTGSTWLARVVIPGNPLANTMMTTLGMGGNNIKKANHITASTVSTNGTTPATGDINAADFNANGGTGNVTSKAVAASGKVQGATITVSGTTTGPAYFHTSDARLKTPLEPVDPWALLAPVRGGRINWLADGRPDLVVIAQDVEQTMPELIGPGPGGFKAVNYGGLIPVLISAVQDLHAKVLDHQREGR